MLNIAECKNILKENGLKLEDNQIKEVREFLYTIAQIALRANNNSISINKDGN